MPRTRAGAALNPPLGWLPQLAGGKNAGVLGAVAMATARTLESAFFFHGGTGLSDMISWLLKASGGEPSEIHVAIETPHRPIVEALLEHGFSVYSINAKQLDRFRDRFTVSGAKDDSLDSYVLADSLRTNMPLFR